MDSIPKDESVELVVQDYAFEPKQVSIKMKWKQKTQLWAQTNRGIVRIYRGWVGRLHRWLTGIKL